MSHLEAWILEAAAVCLLVHIRSLVDNIAGIACFCSFLIMYFVYIWIHFKALKGSMTLRTNLLLCFLSN